MASGECVFDALHQVFCQECDQRMRRVSDIVQAGVPLGGAELDQLHQEFDTLYGGARAVNLPQLERYFRVMARYARHLRNHLADEPALDPLAWQRLQAGIGLGLRCGGLASACLASAAPEHPVLNDIERILQSSIKRENHEHPPR